MGNASTSITISFSADGSTNTEPQDVTLTIKNFCTDATIPNASVTLTITGGATQTQTSNADGQVTFLQVPPGEHLLLVTAQGYLDSSADSLANDAITV